MDGVSMVEGAMSQTGLVSIHGDFPISPEAVDEITTLTLNFDVQYGASASDVTTAITKSGTNSFHGGGYEYDRNTDFNARPFGVADRPTDRENDMGGFIGGPLKGPGFWSNRKKSYFFVNNEEYRSRGSTTKPFLTVPSTAMRSGDFSQWPYPIYDPATTQANSAYNPSLPESPSNLPYTRQQFMGCNGTTPNVICSTDPRLAASLAQGWLKYVPTPTSTALSSNYEPPFGLANSLYADTDQWDVRGDQYIGEKDHVMVTWHYRGALPYVQYVFPRVIDQNGSRIPNYSNIVRINYDHTFGPTLLNHFAGGYLNLPSYQSNASDCCVNELPMIPGVFSHVNSSVMDFQEYSGYDGNSHGVGTRPSWVFNDMVTWVHGKHNFKFGGEFRRPTMEDVYGGNASGTFNFTDLSTGLLGLASGNSMASFLLGEVGNANTSFYGLLYQHPKQINWGIYAGDTWKVTSKLTINPGIRWDVFLPVVDFKNKMSFLDPNAPNPGAGNLPGILAFPGNPAGEPRHPELSNYHGIGPRLSFAYSVSPKTVVRSGYGIFYEQLFYPGWGGGVASDGYNLTQSFTSGLGGLQPAFLLQNGFPTNFTHPPIISPTFDNGENAPSYRPANGGHTPYTQQWNFAVQHQFTADFYVEAMYLGNKGTRLLSATAPLNALNPSLLSKGDALYGTFTPGETSLNGVNAPYAGWAAQMTACPPTVAQALLPYPQYCGNIYGLNENAGNSTYHSLQIKAENRFTHGVYLLASYTLSKLIDDSDDSQISQEAAFNTFSPFQRERGKSLALTDIPQIFDVALGYDLPFGAGQRFLNTGGAVNKVVGGWKPSAIIRLQSPAPFFFNSSLCNVPSQFAASCVPSILPGANPFAQSRKNFNPAEPLFNAAAFQPASTFNFNFGDGSRMSNLRGFGYHNVDFNLEKDTKLTEKLNLEMRFGFFNIFNWHVYTNPGSSIGATGNPQPFITDVNSPSFGTWTGGVSQPRNIQFGLKLVF